MKNWEIKYTKGDLVRDAERDFDVIGHGCNCFNNMGGGIARDVRKNFPGAYKVDVATQMGSKSKLGNYTKWEGDDVTILNLYTQWKYGNRERNADYGAIRSCMKSIKQDFSGKKIGLPLIGAGLAQGDWGTISGIIEDELKEEDVTIVIWERSKDAWQLKLLEDYSRKNSMDKIAVIDSWTEDESGWGCRPDGCSIHLTKEDYKSFVKKYWDGQPNETPKEYSHPDKNLKVIKVSKEFYEEIEKSNGGIRLWESEYNSLEKYDKIEYIL